MKKKSSYKPVEVNKWNRKQWAYPAFMPDEYNDKEKLYWFGGKIWEGIKEGFGNVSFGGWQGLGEALGQGVSRILGVKPENDYGFDAKAYTGGNSNEPQETTEEQMAEKAAATATVGQHAYGGPLYKIYDNGGALGNLGGGISSLGSAVGGAIGGLIGNGYESGVGNVMSSVGKIASVIPGPWGAAISGGLQVLGGGINALFGTKVDQAKLNAANKGTNALRSFKSGATSFDNIKALTAQANIQDPYSAGVFRKGWAEERNKELKRQRAEAHSFADRSITNNISNLAKDQINNAMANYSAFGGPLDGALDYNFMSDLLGVKQQRANQDNNSGLTNMLAYTPSTMFADGGGIHIKPSHRGRLTELKKRTGKTEAELYNDGNPAHKKMVVFARNSRKWKHANGGKLNVLYDDKPVFAFGGDLQTNGSDFGTGLTHINAGSSHELNPNDGVQMGVDNEGVPNLVEEGEVVYDDYVYSNRIKLDQEAKRKFHFPKKADMTYAEAAKKLEREIKEHPNDPISQASFKAQMADLADEQERQKQEMEAARAREAFEALSPEEQTALMQRAAQEEQMVQEQAASQQLAQEQAMAEQQAMQPTPEEAMAMEQQMQAQQAQIPQDNFADQQAIVAANGGMLVKAKDVEPRVNKFSWGSRMKRKYDINWFKKQAKILGIDDKYMEQFGDVFNPNDPDANIDAFNAIFARQQQDQAAETHIKGQRQAKENALFDSKTGLYRITNNGERLLKAKIADKDMEGWITPEGEVINQTVYDERKGKDVNSVNDYHRYKQIAGDRLLDYHGNVIWEDAGNDTEGKPLTKESLLNQYSKDYTKDFKWDEKEAKTLQYPKEMRHSALSNLRYMPALGGIFGLVEDAFTSPDYSGPDAVERAGNVAPMMVSSNYNPTYMTYKPFDRLFYANQLNGQSLATQRALMNTNSPSRAANQLAHAYNTMLANGQLYRQGEEYNDALKKQVATHNSGENKTFAQLDLQAQMANQDALSKAQKLGFEGTYYGNRMRDEIDARRAANRNANWTNVLTSLGNIGEEEYDEDRLKWLEGVGVLRSNYFGRRSAEGGSLKKKKNRGLTI